MSNHAAGVVEEFYVYPQGAARVPKTVTQVHVQDGIVRLQGGAFQGCCRLREVVLPMGLEEVGTGAFQSCTVLEHIHVPSTVVRVGIRAFYCCRSLRSVKLEEGRLTKIGAHAFAFSAIEHIALPSTVTEIGEHAFSDCRCLTDLHLHPCTIAVVNERRIAHQYGRFGEPPRCPITVHLLGGPVQGIPSASHMALENVRSLYARVSIPPGALVVTEVGENLRFSRYIDRTVALEGRAKVFIACDCLNSLTHSEWESLRRSIREILQPNICDFFWHQKRERLIELLRPIELRHNKVVSTILELALWKTKINQLGCPTQAARTSCLHTCGSKVIIPRVMSFLWVVRGVS